MDKYTTVTRYNQLTGEYEETKEYDLTEAFEEYNILQEVLTLRSNGLLIHEICAVLNLSPTQVCTIIREKNDEDIKNDR